MNGFYVDTVPGYRNKKKEKKREVLEKNTSTIVNNKNAYVGVCLYFDDFFIINF